MNPNTFRCSAAFRCPSRSRRSGRRRFDAAIAAAGCSGPASLRKAKDEQVFVTDGGHWILDAHLRVIPDPRELAARLCTIPGVMEHGLFIGNAQTVILAAANGIRLIERP